MNNLNVFKARQRAKKERDPAFKKMLAGLKSSRESMVDRILKADLPVMTASDGTRYKGRNPVYGNIAAIGEVARIGKIQLGVPFVRIRPAA